jgi:uncharacterized protein
VKLKDSYSFSTDKVLKDIVGQIVDIAHPERIILFGSRAMGTQNKDSDYDICVLKNNLKKRRSLAQKIYRKLDILASVDIIVNTPSQYNEIKKSPFLIYYDIDKNGIVLYEK